METSKASAYDLISRFNHWVIALAMIGSKMQVCYCRCNDGAFSIISRYWGADIPKLT